MAHMFTIAEAATACGVSKRTIRRKIEKKDLENAFQDSKKRWKIPLEDLLAAGYKVNEAKNVDPQAKTPDQAKEEAPKDTRLEDLEKQLNAYRERCLIAEAKLEYADKLIKVLEAPKENSKRRWFKRS
jgi:excisionase family DNA binding protein